MLLTSVVAVLTAACGGAVTGPDTPAYIVRSGACGELVFTAAIATDSASAVAEIASRKSRQFGAGSVTIEPYRIDVVDAAGDTPEPRFYALKVVDARNGTLVHSVSEVVTTTGQLFHLRWCPD